jgi:release factor glutamine methyltransferase
MKISQIISHYSKLLKSSSPLLDTELLLSQVLNKPKEYLYTYPEKKLTTKQLNYFTTLFTRRQKSEPTAYILGHKEFFGLDFKVNKNVLIPRPETEQLVEEALQFAKKKKILSVVEIGVGSGAVIISLAKNLTQHEFIGTDISAKALAVAKQNAKQHKAKIHFLQGNLLTPLKSAISNLQSSIIVANLPYLTTKQLNNQQLQYAPKSALAGGPDGLKYFREFFHQLQQYKLQPQAIFLEIGHNQGAKIRKLAQLALPKYKITVKKDLCGFDRVIIITK